MPRQYYITTAPPVPVTVPQIVNAAGQVTPEPQLRVLQPEAANETVLGITLAPPAGERNMGPDIDPTMTDLEVPLVTDAQDIDEDLAKSQTGETMGEEAEVSTTPIPEDVLNGLATPVPPQEESEFATTEPPNSENLDTAETTEEKLGEQQEVEIKEDPVEPESYVPADNDNVTNTTGAAAQVIQILSNEVAPA
jgi:hypothetical protein